MNSKPSPQRIRSTAAAAEHLHVRPDAGMSIHIRAESHNEEDRSFEAVIITDAQTISMDAWTLEQVADITLMDGLTFVDPLPIVDSHVASLFHMTPTTEIRGHVTDIRDEVIDGVNAKVGILRFDSDPASDALYKKVVSGSVKNLSPGYTITRGVELSPGETAIVGGRTFTAPNDKPLLVGTETRVTEISAVLRGADPLCRIRAEKARKQNTAGDSGETGRGSTAPGSVTPSNGSLTMPKELKQYLIRCGLDANATDQQAEDFCAGLTGDQAIEAKRLRAAPTGNPAPQPQPTDAERIRAEERQRIASIEELAGDDTPRELVRSAITEGWDVGRASQAFLQSMRDRRSANGGTPAGAPAGHVRTGAGETTRALVVSQLMRAGIQPDSEILANSRMRAALQRYDLDFLCDEARRVRSSGAFSDGFAREIEYATEMRYANSLDFSRELLRLQGVEAPRQARELIRTAFSGGSLAGVLDSVIYARMAVAFEAMDDFTRGVVAEGANSDFKGTKRIMFSAGGRMVEMPRGGTPNVATVADEAPLTYTKRMAESIVLDEIDMINGAWGELESRVVEELAEDAVRLRMDIVVAMLLQAETQTYTADNAAVVSAGRKNLITSAILDATNLEAARALIATATLNGKTLAQVPRFLVTSEAQWGQGNRLVNGGEVRSTASETTVADAVLYPTANSVRSMNLTHISSGLFDNGVPDPSDPTGQATVAGDNDRFYLLAGQRNAAIELTSLNGYGEGGVPILESSDLEGGARGRRFTAVSFLSGNWINPRGLVVLRP